MSEMAAAAAGGNPLALFQESFYRISEEIFSEAEQDATRRGMGIPFRAPGWWAMCFTRPMPEIRAFI